MRFLPSAVNSRLTTSLTLFLPSRSAVNELILVIVTRPGDIVSIFTLPLKVLRNAHADFSGLAQSMQFHLVVLFQENFGNENEFFGLFLGGDLKLVVLGVQLFLLGLLLLLGTHEYLNKNI